MMSPMKKPLLYVILWLLIMAPLGAIAAETGVDGRLSLIRTYFARLDVIYREGSSVADIDALFELFHEDVRYEHVAYEAEFDNSAWRQAFLDNLKRGAYKKGTFESTSILKTIPGSSHVAVEYAYGRRNEAGSWTQESAGMLILFGFQGDRIILVREYWE